MRHFQVRVSAQELEELDRQARAQSLCIPELLLKLARDARSKYGVSGVEG